MRCFFRILAGMCTMSLALASAAAWAQKAPEVCSGQVNQPGDVSLQVTLKNGQSVFREGEMIALTAQYTAATEKKYFASTRNYDRSGRLSGVETFCVEPDAGSDPLEDYFNGVLAFMGGGLSGEQVLGSEPYDVPLELNEWVSLPPGSYRLRIVSNRVAQPDNDALNPFAGAAVPLKSNEVSFEVIAADAGWEAGQLAQAVHTLDSADPASDEAKHAARTLRFLGSEGAARELVRRYWSGNDEPFGWEFKFGLFGSQHRSTVVEAMKAALGDPQHPVTQEFIQTLAQLETAAEPALKPPAYDATNEADWRRARDSRFAAIDKLVAQYTDEAAAAVAKKTGPARAVTVNELLQSNAKLSPAAQTELRQMLAVTWDTMPVRTQNELLEFRWDVVGGPELLPVLRKIAAEEPGATRRIDKPDRGMSVLRIYELDPAVGRAMILAEIAHVHGDMRMDVLGILPERELPQVEAPVIAQLNGRLGAPEVGEAPEVAYELVDRYFTARALDAVEKTYEANNGAWDCREQAALMRYFLRVSPEYGVARVKDASGVRGTGCYGEVFTGLKEYVRVPKVESIAIRALDDPLPEVVRDAAGALQKYGSAKAEGALWARLKKFHEQWKDREGELHNRLDMPQDLIAQVGLEQELAYAITNAQAWIVSDGDIERLRELVGPQEQVQLNGLLDMVKQGSHSVILIFSPQETVQFVVDRYTGNGMAALNEKLAEFPAGTRFEASTTVAERGRHAAEFDELEAAAAADGLSLHVQTPR